ncbi:MAG: IS607 family transposase, partial [Lachnospiraceae bacterium]|nr:IS607 family transposase [Lachnospiraceae bacterium]
MYKLSEFTKQMYRAGEIKDILGVTLQTLHNYDRDGIIRFDRTEGGHRIVSKEELIKYLDKKGLLVNDLAIEKKDVVYARVSSGEQKTKGDLDRQALAVLEGFSGQIKNPIILKEVGSGLNDKRKLLLKLIDMVLNNEVNAIYITYRDRLTRFGFHYIEKICDSKGVEIHILHNEREEDVNK